MSSRRIELELHKAAESVSKSEAGSCFLKQETLSLYLEGRGISLRNTYEVILGRAEQSTPEEHRVPCLNVEQNSCYFSF